jgi:hypothetical protein
VLPVESQSFRASLTVLLILGAGCSGSAPTSDGDGVNTTHPSACLTSCSLGDAFVLGCRQGVVCVENVCGEPAIVRSVSATDGYRLFEQFPFVIQPESTRQVFIGARNPVDHESWQIALDADSAAGPERLVIKGTRSSGFEARHAEVIPLRPVELLLAVEVNERNLPIVREKFRHLLDALSAFSEVRVGLSGRSGRFGSLLSPALKSEKQAALDLFDTLPVQAESAPWLSALTQSALTLREDPTVVLVTDRLENLVLDRSASAAERNLTLYYVSEACTPPDHRSFMQLPPGVRARTLCTSNLGGFVDLLPSTHRQPHVTYLEAGADLNSFNVTDADGLDLPSRIKGELAPNWEVVYRNGSKAFVLYWFGSWKVSVSYVVEVACVRR